MPHLRWVCLHIYQRLLWWWYVLERYLSWRHPDRSDHIYDYENYSILNKELKCRANTGFSAIFDLLENEAKGIFITGFSFYLDSFIKGYKKGSNKNEEDFADECFNSIRHNQNNQWSYLKSKKNNPKFSFDPVLKEILNLKKLDKRKFVEIMSKYA